MPADRTEYYKQYYLDHKETINQNSRQYRLIHPEVDKNYKERHKNEIAQKSREYYIRTKLGGDVSKLRNKSKKKETILEAVVETPKIRKPKKTPMERKRDAIAKDLAIIQKKADNFKLLLNNIADAEQSRESERDERVE